VSVTARVHVADLSLRSEVRAADRTHAHRRSIFLELDDEGVPGWGECATSEGPGVDPTVDEVLAALDERVLDLAVSQLASRPVGSAPRAPTVALVAARPAMLAAAGLVDAALWDLRLRAEGRSLAEDLGVSARDVAFAGVVGVMAPGASAARAEALVAEGATRLRVKVSPDAGTRALEAVLAAVGVPVVADANASFAPGGDDAALAELCALPIAWLEQPFAANNLVAHAALAERVGVPIGLDESVRSLRWVRDAARYHAATVLCCKPSRLGGIARTVEALRTAGELGLRCYVGGYFEAGLARAVLGTISAVAGTEPGDVVAPAGYLDADPCGLAGPRGGRQPLHLAPGCGPPPERSALRQVLVRTA